MSDRYEKIVAAVLDAPLHRSLGIELIDSAAPESGIKVSISDAHTNIAGVLHGGLVPLFLDVASYLAVAKLLEPGTNAVTVDHAASLIGAVSKGSTVEFSAQVNRRGRSLAFIATRAQDGGRLVATSQLVKAIVPAPPELN